MFENNARGVRGTVPVERAPANIAPNTLLDVAPLEQSIIRYVDGEGVIRVTVVLKLGGAYYVPSNAEEWAKNCRPVNEWLDKLLRARDKAVTSVPETSVDVMGGPEDG